MVLTIVAFLICFELPRREFALEAAVPTWIGQGTGTSRGTLVSLSMRRATIRLGAVGAVSDGGCRVTVPPLGEIAGRVVRRSDREVDVELDTTPEQHRQLLVFLYSQPMHHVAAHASMAGALRGLLRRAFVTG